MKPLRPHEKVEQADYFRDVLNSMCRIPQKDLRRVRFGLMGEGIAPNYEIVMPDGHPKESSHRFPINGVTHRDHHQAPEPFDLDHLTEKFDWDEVTEMLEQCLSRKKL